ncbi:MAG: DUF2889 domain-containing protein [Rhodocyclaceae bacterium]|nr:DUF2889 domain-containing protein [Rhodocyclaceae bacterium]
MPLSAHVPRQPLHHRKISARGYKRDDGLFEVEGHLIDTKAYSFKLRSGERLAGEPVHEMWLRITYDTSMTIIDAEASSDAHPYPGFCGEITPRYRAMIGWSMRPGFSAKVRAAFGGIKGCTHLTDLISVLATTAYQNLAGQLPSNPEKKPFQLDGCHALASDAAAVATFYPKWYRGDGWVDQSSEDDQTNP